MPITQLMSRSGVICALLALLVCLAAPADAATKRQRPRGDNPHRQPSRSAQQERTLWATVNACNTPQRPNAAGIRVSMPARGGRAQWIRVRVQYFNSLDRTWRLLPAGGDAGWDRIGNGRRTVQSGWTFTFQTPSPGHRIVVRGLVDFQWRSGRRVIYRARQLTKPGHTNPADDLLPDSRASCEIDGPAPA